MEVYLHSFLTSALDRSDVISWSKYFRNLKQFVIESVRQRLMDWLWIRQWSDFISGIASHTLSSYPATPSAQTVIHSFITIHFIECIRWYDVTPHDYLLDMEFIRRKTSLAMVSTVSDALNLISTVLSTVLVKLMSEVISENIFSVDYLIRQNATFIYSGQYLANE